MVNVLLQVLLFAVSGVTLYKAEVLINGTSSSDFHDVVGSQFFVDKSLLIREVFTELSKTNQSGSPGPVLLKVRVGPRFGKTVNQNMIKRFLEIAVDEKGDPIDPTLTDNYRLFQNNKLKIVNDVVFSKQFGRHPVININYKSLSEVTNFDHMIEKYRQIVLETFLEHSYLLAVKRLWELNFNKTHFEMFTDAEQNQQLHKYYIYCSFQILAKVLHVHFDKPVIVLVDDVDAIEDSPAYSTREDKRRIENFVKDVTDDLLVSNDDVKAVLLTGSVHHRGNPESRVTSLPTSSTLWQYYGLSQQELQSLLMAFSDVTARVKRAADDIVEGFNRQYKSKQDHNPASVWSVAQYLASENNALKQ